MGYTEEKLETNNYSCPNCGGECSFDPKTQQLTCLYCNSKVDIEKANFDTEQDISQLFQNAKVWDETEVVQCKNCGAKENISKGGIATHCSFCGTNNIVKTSEIVGMKPHGLCPFVITNEQASELAVKWAKSKIFAPNKFKKSAEAKAISGVYSPAFTFDCSTETRYRGELGETKTRTKRNPDGKLVSESYTDYFPIAGHHSATFDDVIVHTSANIPEIMLDKLGSYPTSTASEYDEKFLVGYTANTYAKDGVAAWQAGKAKIDYRIKRQILSKYHHDVVRSFYASTKYSDRSFKYLLLPVYVGHYNYKNVNYNFYVNGSTGKVSGKAPVSWVKILFTILGAVGLFVLITLLSIM